MIKRRGINILNKISKLLIITIVTTIIGNNIDLSIAGNAINSEAKIPVLLYHHINEVYTPDIAYANLTPAEFKIHMLTLKAKKYDIITFQDYYDYIANGTPLPPNPLIISFDDGYSSNYTDAYPILKQLDMKATIFVVTDTVGKKKGEGVNYPHFTWEEAKEMEESGVIDIQSHSNSHRNMSELSAYEIQKELRRSRYLIEYNLNKKCTILAYPYGGYNDATIELARKAGYVMQVLVADNLMGGGANMANIRSDGLESIKRLTVFGHMSNEELIEMIENSMDAR